MSLPQGKEKFDCVHSCMMLKVNSNRGIRLKTRMSFFVRPPLFLCYGNVNLNYCVEIKEKRQKNFYGNQGRNSEAE